MGEPGAGTCQCALRSSSSSTVLHYILPAGLMRARCARQLSWLTSSLVCRSLSVYCHKRGQIMFVSLRGNPFKAELDSLQADAMGVGDLPPGVCVLAALSLSAPLVREKAARWPHLRRRRCAAFACLCL